MKRFLAALLIFTGFGCQAQIQDENPTQKQDENMSFKVQKSEDDWRNELSSEEFQILRKAGTERPFTGEYNLHFKDGVYRCAACDAPLFKSDSKFESDCGWPSFDKAMGDSTVVERLDKSHGMTRTEILCANCGGHLGHLFEDGPTETGMRYCINSVSLDFEGEENEKKQGEKEKAEE